LEKVTPLADEVKVDRIGNILAFKRGRGDNKKHALLCAHMDEVGLIVIGINDNGLLSYDTVGTIDSRVLVSKRVLIGEKKVPGVIGAKAIHLQTKEEYEKVLKHSQLFIDIGAKDKASAESLVSPGDYVSLDGGWVEFGDGFVKSKALDDRVGCAALISLLEGEYPCDITCAFTVQEEIGCRGSFPAGWQVSADCAVIFEGTSANDLGDVEPHLRVCEPGKGVAISFMDNSSIGHRGLVRALRELAIKHNIPWQVKAYVSGGNDTRGILAAHGAIACAVLSVPCRYIHSPSNVACFRDIASQIALAEAFLSSGAIF